MTTERLLDDLTARLAPVRRRSALRDAGLLLLLGGIELGLFLASGMARPDIAQAMHTSLFWWKVGGTGLIALAGSGVAIRSFAPDVSPRAGLQQLAALVVATVLVGWLVVEPGPGTMMTRASWRAGMGCAGAMMLLSLPFLGALAILMRRGAASRPGASALAAGIAAAGSGAFVFAFHCHDDDLLHVTAWYLVGCGLATLAARWLLPRVARW